jgi:hypothetical protein
VKLSRLSKPADNRWPKANRRPEAYLANFDPASSAAYHHRPGAMRPTHWCHQPGTVGALRGAAAELEGLVIHARESSDNPRLHAFCRVAFSVRLSILAMSLAGLFRFANAFNLRSCPDVQTVLLKGFFIGKRSPVKRRTN